MHRNCVLDVAVEIETVFPPVEGRPHAGFNAPLGSARNVVLLELPRSWCLGLEVSGCRPLADVQLPDVKCARPKSAIGLLQLWYCAGTSSGLDRTRPDTHIVLPDRRSGDFVDLVVSGLAAEEEEEDEEEEEEEVVGAELVAPMGGARLLSGS